MVNFENAVFEMLAKQRMIPKQFDASVVADYQIIQTILRVYHSEKLFSKNPEG